MPKKYNNYLLIIILVVLIAAWFLTKLFKSERNIRSFITDIVTVDTASIKSISIFPESMGREEIKFEKRDNKWITSLNNITDDADQSKVENIIKQLNEIKATRLVARTEEKWEEFQLTDSLASRVKILDKKGETVTDILLGKFSYNRLNPQQSYSRNNIQGISYVRLAGEKEIYAVDGFLNMAFNMDFSYWRDQQIIKAEKNNITKLSFKYPADSGFVALENDSKWNIGSMEADSASMDKYLSSLRLQSGSTFADEFSPENDPDYQLVIDGNNMSQIIVAGYERSPADIVIHSNQNPDSYFTSSKDGVFSRIFKSKVELLK